MKKTFDEILGTNAEQFIRLLAEGHSIYQISEMMPKVLKTPGTVAGITNRHRYEISTRVAEYRKKHKPERVGRSRPFKRTEGKGEMAEKEPEAEATTNEELETAALGYDDWEKHERGNPHAYAIGPVNVGRMQAPPEERKQSIRAEVFEELVRKRGGIAVFLRASTAFAKRHGIGTQKRAQTIESRVRAREPKG